MSCLIFTFYFSTTLPHAEETWSGSRVSFRCNVYSFLGVWGVGALFSRNVKSSYAGRILQFITILQSVVRHGVSFSITHSLFGDVKKLLTMEFVRQGYLDHTRQPNTDPPVYEYRWGFRARKEMTKRNCLDFVSKVS